MPPLHGGYMLQGMDSVTEIKARLSIEQLVGRYCQLTKKGRDFVALCPFHHDTHPSFLVSPEKGICYCFPCQKGGDIFSFYQLIENVDFPQAIRDLAEMTGVQVEEAAPNAPKKGEKDRMRDCLAAAARFYAERLNSHAPAMAYLQQRGVTQEEIAHFGIGLAPDGSSPAYDHLLKNGFSRTEIIAAGIAGQKDLAQGGAYDRFRNRIMFPIKDVQGRIVGFGGRTLENDQAKYINSSDSPLYRKSAVLYGVSDARDAIRQSGTVILVEGYFDVLACHRMGVKHAVATCGTALTEEHVRLLRRYATHVALCLDQDDAGRNAADRAYALCVAEGLQVSGILLAEKDPADLAQSSPDALRTALTVEPTPYLEQVLEEVRRADRSSPAVRAAHLRRVLPLVRSIAGATEREYALRQTAAAFGATETALEQDMRRLDVPPSAVKKADAAPAAPAHPFTAVELTLGLALLYPHLIGQLKQLIPPEEEFPQALRNALLNSEGTRGGGVDDLELSPDHRQRAHIVALYCEESGFHQWNDAVAMREIGRNIRTANRELLRRKQTEITKQLIAARSAGDTAREQELRKGYQEVLQLGRGAV